MSELKVNKVSPRSGTSFTLGDSGDTFTVPSGATLTTTDATVNLPATQTVTTELKTNKISPASGTAFTFGDSGDTFTIPSGATIANSGTATGFGGGKIGQVVSTTKTDRSTFTSTSFTSISGFNVSITPTATSSKIFLMCSFSFGTTSNVYGGIRFLRDSTAIAIGDADGVRHQATAPMSNSVIARAHNTDMNFLDSPNTTSATTYHVQVKVNSGQTVSVNSSGEDENNTDTGFRYVSTITAMEVLA
tara:strand:- start:242 stop:982 length:741 start_codon:yes stop_codon:yes gene_type:complete